MNTRKIKKKYRNLIGKINSFFSIFGKNSTFLKDYKINNLFKEKIQNFLNKKKIYKKKKNIFLNKKEKYIFKKRQSKKNIQINIFNNNLLNKYYKNIIIFTILFIILLLFFLSFGSYFKIKNNRGVEINRKDNITNMNIAYESIKFIRGQSIFNIEKKEIINKLKIYQENIKNVKINIIFPDKLKILIESYKGLFNTQINGKHYIITSNGVLVPSKNNSALKFLEIKSNKDLKNKFLDYKIYFKSKYINNINQIINKIEENIINLKIEKILFYQIERELHITTKNNTILIFNINGNIEEQIKKLIILKQDYKKIYNTSLYYIDLRIQHKIFICTKEKEYLCKRNIKEIYSYE